MRTRTELECIIEDLKIAGEKGEERRFVGDTGLLLGILMQRFGRDGLETELRDVEGEIQDKEVEIMEIDPDLDMLRNTEAVERKRRASPRDIYIYMNNCSLTSKARRIRITSRRIVC